MKLEFSPRSLDDLTGILSFIARDNSAAAVRFVEELEEHCRLPASFQHIGIARTDLLPSLRLFNYQGYGIYFRVVGDNVRIERVLHNARDVKQDFFG